MATTVRSSWTGTKGVADCSDLPYGWNEEVGEKTYAPPDPLDRLLDDPEAVPKFAVKIWLFFSKEFPEDAKTIMNLWLEKK